MIFMNLQHISHHYPEDRFLAGCHRVVKIEGEVIEAVLGTATWTKVMDGRWEIQPAQPIVCASKTYIDNIRKMFIFSIVDQS